MDFEFHFSKELEDFRKEVRAFIKENALKEPFTVIGRKMSPEINRKGKEMRKKMGAKGWYAPGYPKEYGGGGLDIDRCVILAEEFGKIDKEHLWPSHWTEISGIYTGGIMAHGTEEQKKKFLTKILRGEWDGYQCFTEPDAGSDEAAMQSTAVRDGDVFIINGTKIYVGQMPEPIRPDYLYWPAVTDPKAPRHENISAFFIPANLPGITYKPLDLTGTPVVKWEITCNDVRCPADHLIGELNKGWLVTQATLALEHGGGGALVPRHGLVLDIIDYCKKTVRGGKPISEDPRIQDILVQLYIDFNADRLLNLRNYAATQGQIPRARYTGTQTSLLGKRFQPVLGKALLDILGPYALLEDPELIMFMGEVEMAVELADCTHPGGTPEVQQIMMARGLGLGRKAKSA